MQPLAPIPPIRRWALVLCLVLGTIACDHRETEPTADDGPEAHPPGAGAEARRLVTLAPGLTQMLVDLGLADQLVGVAEHDAAAPGDVPIVGHFADVDTETLLSLEPTHVLTMRTSQAPPARLRELAAADHFELLTYAYPDSIDEALDILHRESADGDPPPVGEALGLSARAAELHARLRDDLAAVRAVTDSSSPPKVLLVIGTRSVMASGPGTVLDELLGYAGARNAAAGASVMAPTYDREGLLALEPEVILLLLPHAAPLSENDARLAEFRDLPIPAVENDRIELIDDPLVLLPSTNLARTAATLATAIHPSLADELGELFADRDVAGAFESAAASGTEAQR